MPKGRGPPRHLHPIVGSSRQTGLLAGQIAQSTFTHPRPRRPDQQLRRRPRRTRHITGYHGRTKLSFEPATRPRTVIRRLYRSFVVFRGFDKAF